MKVEQYPYHSFQDGQDFEPIVPRGVAEQKAQQQAQLQEAEASGYARGLSEGKAAGIAEGQAQRQQLEQQIKQLIANLDPAIQSVQHSIQQQLEEILQALSGLTASIAEKLAGDALKEFPEAQIKQAFTECAALLTGGKKLIWYVPVDAVDYTKETLATLASESQLQKLTLMADPALRAGQCRLVWEGGEATYDNNDLIQQVQQIIQTHFGKSMFSNNPNSGV
ncbi:MAG: hypothetical protein H6908_02320 [Hyphomicrobiales bacterium]|nr:hypothetical protein [Hyphomicrobiales bacterium]